MSEVADMLLEISGKNLKKEYQPTEPTGCWKRSSDNTKIKKLFLNLLNKILSQLQRFQGKEGAGLEYKDRQSLNGYLCECYQLPKL